MKAAPIPGNEDLRLQSLSDLMILDSDAEQQFDDLVSLASEITGCAVSLVSLIDKDRQWFKAKVGTDLEQTPRNISFCSHAVAQEGDDLFVVENALEDERFFDNPLVTGGSKIRFYAGQPLVTPSGFKLGTLCVIDDEPKKLSAKQMRFLKIISNQVIALFELRKEVLEEKAESLKKIAFVSSMSHEIRTPLTALSGYVEILNEEATAEEREKYGSYLSALSSNSKHLLELVSNILDFSKLEVNKVDVKKKRFSSKAMMKQIEGIFILEAQKKGIDFKIQSQKVPPYLKTDATLLKQIIINLVSNAIKFTSEGQVKLMLSYHEESQALRIQVKDTGMGISEEDAKRIFSPFSQALEGAAKMPGTGLGLGISKQLSELLGGGLDLVDTEIGMGSTFEAWIKAEPSTSISKIKLLKSEAPILKNAKRVLIVDDSYDNRFLLGHFLKDTGVSFDEAINGTEALSLAAENIYDYIFLDMQLPDMSGFEVFEKLKIKGKESVGVVAFTASSTAEEKQRCLDIGFSGFLAKPFSKNDVSSLFEFKELKLT